MILAKVLGFTDGITKISNFLAFVKLSPPPLVRMGSRKHVYPIWPAIANI